MSPVGNSILHDTGNNGGTGRFDELLLRGVIENCPMPMVDCALQKKEGIRQLWLGLALESIHQGLSRDLGGNFAMVMPPHPIGDNQQQRIAGIAVRGTILIIAPPTLATLLINREFHLSCVLKIPTSRSSQPLSPATG